MKAKDTISFRVGFNAGYRQCGKDGKETFQEMRQICKLEGISEVVDWINRNTDNTGFRMFDNQIYGFEYESWQARVKEWGVKNR